MSAIGKHEWSSKKVKQVSVFSIIFSFFINFAQIILFILNDLPIYSKITAIYLINFLSISIVYFYFKKKISIKKHYIPYPVYKAIFNVLVMASLFLLILSWPSENAVFPYINVDKSLSGTTWSFIVNVAFLFCITMLVGINAFNNQKAGE